MHDRDYYHRNAVKSKCANHWSTYRILRCKVNEEVKKPKSTYNQDCINLNKKNPAGLWKVLKITSRDNRSQNGPSRISSDVSHSDSKSIANVLTNILPQLELNLLKKLLKRQIMSSHLSTTRQKLVRRLVLTPLKTFSCINT